MSAPHPDRLVFLDGLRGLAALIVFFSHTGSAIWPTAPDAPLVWAQVGQCGVIIFFLCSGFIIPVSLTRGARSFWIKRFFRLYPLYWVSIALAVGCAGLGFGGEFARALAHDPRGTLLANLTMIPSILDAELLMSVYWTLKVELLFYVIASLQLWMGLQRQVVPLTIGFLGIAAGTQALIPIPAAQNVLALDTTYLTVMFFGMVFAQVYQGHLRSRVAVVFTVVLLGLLVALAPLDARNGGNMESYLALQAARLLGFAIFGGALLLRHYSIPCIACWLGTISYSLYLMHPIVLTVVPQQSTPPITLLLWTITLIVIAAATYYAVEQPSMVFGRRLTRANRTTVILPALSSSQAHPRQAGFDITGERSSVAK
jgi:peptidoglycan/LPS O-acetylase OafA/YrhL